MHSLTLSSSFETLPAIFLLLHLASYALFDHLLRRGGLDRALAWIGLSSHLEKSLAVALGCFALLPFTSWDRFGSDAQELRFFSCAGLLLLSWNAATRDFDPVERPNGWLRILLLGASGATFWSPSFALLCAFILSCGFAFWLHHATFPMRVLQALLAYFFLQALTQFPLGIPFREDVGSSLHSGFITFLIVMQVSHYFITALAKMLLGPKWYSWVWDNRLHHLVASAYSWGWGRFLPWSSYRRLVFGVKALERPLQLCAFCLELLAPLALFSSVTAKFFSLAFALFHGGVFVLSGLLFWDWILMDLLIFGLLSGTTEQILGSALNPTQMALGLLLMGLFPLRHKIWKPMPLGWFDTPLTARIHWQAVGRSGKLYEVYNDFMCPHDRLYGRVNGCFFVPHPVVNYHLGEVFKPDLRREIVECGPSLSRLSRVRKRFGILPHDVELQDRHLRYLRAFFSRLNHGAKKAIFPSWLRLLKAPGDQIYYWGDLPAYKRQEPITEVRLRFVEEYFDGERFHRLVDEEVARTAIPENPVDADPELTPKQLDHFLLQLAEGRLLDLPKRKKRYAKVLSEV